MSVRSLLVATDFSENARRAARRAALIARELGTGRLVLMHVAPRQAALERGLRRRMQDLVRELRAQTNVAFAPRLAHGAVVDVLARAASRFDLVVVGAQGMHPWRDLALGSSADRLLRKIARPVLVVKRAPAVAYRQVLAPVDFSPDARAALEFAAQLAPQAALHVLHAFEAPLEGKLRFAGVDEESVRHYRQQSRARARAELDAMLAQVRLPAAHLARQIVHGYAPDAIARAGNTLGADLVAIGKHGRSALEDLLLGSVTLRTLAAASCDVLVVPAKGRAVRARR